MTLASETARWKTNKQKTCKITCILYSLSVLVRVISVTVGPIIEVTQVILLWGNIVYISA